MSVFLTCPGGHCVEDSSRIVEYPILIKIRKIIYRLRKGIHVRKLIAFRPVDIGSDRKGWALALNAVAVGILERCARRNHYRLIGDAARTGCSWSGSGRHTTDCFRVSW